MKYTTPLLTIICIAFLMTGCQTGKKDRSNAADPDPGMADEAVYSRTDEGLITIEHNGIRLTEVVSPAFSSAKLDLVTPESGAALTDTTVAFEFGVEDYELGIQTTDADIKNCANSVDGQHIHLILNNEPYTAHYVSSFSRELSKGSYIALAFLSRSYHESIKSPSAYQVFTFNVGDAAEPAEFDAMAPHMFYSRPKGTYNGEDTKKVLLDFYLVNADLAPEGYKVKATINGSEFLLEKWVPYAMEGLPDGITTIELTLLDITGAKVESPFNPVVRTVTLAQ